jgi:hypothetical protein
MSSRANCMINRLVGGELDWQGPFSIQGRPSLGESESDVILQNRLAKLRGMPTINR